MNLSDSDQLRAFLSRSGIRADKGLGQNFLCSPPVVDAILARLSHCSGILEIGPGPGVLTQRFEGRTVVALELDPRMVQMLRTSAPFADVRQSDALRTDFFPLLDGMPAPRAIVGNIPYYITSPLLERVAGVGSLIDRAVLMMQREVGERIAAPAGNSARGSPSVFLQSRFEIQKVIDVPPDAFIPPPKVHSTVMELLPRVVSGATEEVFRIVRAGFTQPRKTLANNLSAVAARPVVVAAIERLGLSATVRPHELTLEAWIEVAARLGRDTPTPT